MLLKFLVFILIISFIQWLDYQDGTAFNGIAVTAPGRARQYNTITEKYVNNAVRENDKTNVTVVNPINEEEIQDQQNIEHIKVIIDENRNNYMDGGPNIVESLQMEGKNEKRIVSHAERLHEHYKVLKWYSSNIVFV